ncbi:MAG: FtsX-like permease family protein [Candidatus Abyssobacteria bacterium SURF_5]|uniref:FtsX-like permease family protein n=1 Tax=Abyssobacteria bacterium (strain SURF_5) TaxID=2093360 RepID=A0A3A4N1U4_ABYX5|nr:MAG: FtsX-like permease family protein [Candidatus Abyssubacteria bacterium SURF_5]
MKTLGIIRDGMVSLRQHRFRTFLSTLGIIFGVTAIIAMVSIGEGSKREALALIEQLGKNNVILRSLEPAGAGTSGKQVHAGGLSKGDLERIQARVTEAENVAPLLQVKAAMANARMGFNPEIISTTGAYQKIMGLSVSEGRFICLEDVDKSTLCCCIGWDVLESLGSAGRVGQSLRIENTMFKIVGILGKRDWNTRKSQSIAARNVNRLIIIPLGTEKALVSSQSVEPEVSEIIAQVKPGSDVLLSAKLLKRIVDENHRGLEDFHMIVPQELLNQARRTHRVYNAVLGCIAAISLVVGGIGIMNIMLATVSERTREIGIRRAVGANQTHIFLQFLFEAAMLTSLGGAIGICCGIVASGQIARLIGWETVISGWAVTLSLLTAVFVGICSGMYPAVRAARMDPVAALRFE